MRKSRALLLLVAAALTGTTGMANMAQAAPNRGTGSGAMVGQSAVAVNLKATPVTTACHFKEVDSCRSTDPNVKIYWDDSGDTSGCTFTWSIDWGDKIKAQTVTVNGQSASGIYFLADHTYQAPSTTTYTITVTAESVTGGCTISGGSATFTLLVRNCDIDQVAQTTEAPTVGQHHQLGRKTTASGTFYYGGALQFATADGAQGTYVVADPTVTDCHSLAELAVQSTDGNQIVEVGWTVDPGLFSIDPTQAHLFVYHWVNRQESCYDGCGFKDTGKLAGKTLPVGSTQVFEIEYLNGNWEILDNDVEVGYFPGDLWKTPFTQAGLVQWFGEVAAGAKTTAPCSQMGNGQFGSSAGADTISNLELIDGPAVSPSLNITNASYYDATYATNTLSFGGPGGCSS
jgi:Neprosin